jgi:hypothetical protein
MSSPPASLALAAHLAVLSMISFGGIPTVLPDIHNLVVVTKGWVTDQEFADFFAIAQALPGLPMILMIRSFGTSRTRARGKSQQIRHFCAGGDFASYANPLVFLDTDFVKRQLLRAAHRETAGKSRFCAIFGSICAPSSAHISHPTRAMRTRMGVGKI